MRTAFKVLAAAAPLALCSTSIAQEINDRFLSVATVSKAAKPKSSKKWVTTICVQDDIITSSSSTVKAVNTLLILKTSLFMVFSADAKADKMNASTATKAAKMNALSSGSQSLIGLWTGIDQLDGSTIRFSISCDDVGEFFRRRDYNYCISPIFFTLANNIYCCTFSSHQWMRSVIQRWLLGYYLLWRYGRCQPTLRIV